MDNLISELFIEFSLSRIQWIISKDPNPLSIHSLKLLKKLWNKSSACEKHSLSQVYAHFLKKTTNKAVNFLIALANDSLQAVDYFKGAEISDEIEYHVFNLFRNIQETEVLEYNEFYSISQVTEKYKAESEKKKIQEIAARIVEGDHFAMQDLTNLLCSFTSTRKLFSCIESEFEELISSFKSVKSLQIYVQVLNFLNTILIESSFCIDHTVYYPSYLAYYKTHKKVFKTLWKIVKIVAEADIVVSQNLIKIVPKFWNIFQEKRMKMAPDLILLLKSIQAAKYLDSMQMAEKFAYQIFTDPKVDPALKCYLKSELNELLLEKGFCYQQKPTHSIETLKINTGFPLMTTIEAGEKFIVNVSVSPGSIFYCAFVLESQNINFSIKSDSQVYCSEQNVTTQTPLERKFYIQDQQILTIEWDNSYSWLNSKTLRFRVAVLHRLHSVIQDKNPACAILDQDSLILLTSDKRQEHFSPADPYNSIIEFTLKNNKNSLNFLTCSEINTADLGIAAVSHMIDIELVAKFAYHELKDEKIVVVSNSPAFRACLVHNGKVIKGSRICGGLSKDEDFDEFVQRISKRFTGALVFFKVKEEELWKEKLGEKGIVVNGLEIDLESLVMRMKEIDS